MPCLCNQHVVSWSCTGATSLSGLKMGSTKHVQLACSGATAYTRWLLSLCSSERSIRKPNRHREVTSDERADQLHFPLTRSHRIRPLAKPNERFVPSTMENLHQGEMVRIRQNFMLRSHHQGAVSYYVFIHESAQLLTTVL